MPSSLPRKDTSDAHMTNGVTYPLTCATFLTVPVYLYLNRGSAFERRYRVLSRV